MSEFAQYDARKIAITWKGFRILGFAPDTFCRISFSADAFTKQVGGRGDVTRSGMADESAEVGITLMRASQTNDELSRIHRSDRRRRDGVGKLQIEDLLGNLLAVADKAWLRKNPDIELGAEDTDVEWMFDCAQLDLIAGGSVTE